MIESEFLIRNAVIYSGLRDATPHEAMLVRGGRIVALGTAEHARGHGSPGAEEIDLEGATVLPGLVDVHNHHMMAGESDLFHLAFSPGASFAEILAAVADAADGFAPDDWIVGEAWGSTLVDELSHETARHRLDAVSGGRPVVLTDDSHHNKFVNSAALAAAGITADTEPPRDGRIVLDPETGAPTGLLYESATLPVVQAMHRSGERTPRRTEEACARGVEILNSYGITAFQDAAATVDIMAALHALDHRDGLNAWVVTSMLSSEFLFADTLYGAELVEQGERFRSAHHRPDFVKVALDGVPPTQTAAFLTPYVDADGHDHGHCGTTTMSTDELTDWLLWTAERGVHAKIHCTGDAATRVALDAIETVRDAGYARTRYHIAHGQYVHPDDLERFASLGVSADISPFLWFPGVIPESIARVRPREQAEQMQPNRTLIDSGALVAGGSDWPVSESPNPWEGIQGLVTREDPLHRAEGTLWLDQAITLGEAIEVFTINGAKAMGLDDVTGSIEPGKSADFVILNQDPYRVPINRVIDTRAEQTWLRGQRVF